MPGFQSVVAGTKRKSDGPDLSGAPGKRPALDDNAGSTGAGTCWMVQWRVPQQKKHKTWDGDAVLVVNRGGANLVNLEGKLIASGKVNESVEEGKEFHLGGKDLEIDHPIPWSEYLSGACFGAGTSSSTAPSTCHMLPKQSKPFKPVALNPDHVRSTSRTAGIAATPKKGIQLEPVDLMADNRIYGSQKDSYWTANWRKHQQKKHKTWDGDAFVMQKGDKLTLVSETGKILGSKKCTDYPLYSGYHTFVGSREVELDAEIPLSQMPTITGQVEEPVIDPEYDPAAYSSQATTPLKSTSNALSSPTAPLNSASTSKKYVAPANFYAKVPQKPKKYGPLHDPENEGSVVMKAPTPEHIARFNKKNSPVVPVVIDPILSRRLRPHQKEGVKFMYECVMGLRKHEGQGCILADEMGLGKTLQTIALVWTLLKQNPYAGVGPVVGKVLIVCPVSLVNNWKMEFHKWLGKDRVGVFIGDKDKNQIKQFINSKIHQVLVIGYEKLRSVIEALAYCHPPIGLIICDEGHRLKSSENKTSKMFQALKTPRRIILSGTPVQNDLGEFHSMADFCNPGLLDDYKTFRRVYEQPILKSRAPDCTSKEAELGQARQAQLTTISKSFVLRREASILGNYLPPKYEYVVFVTPTSLQLSMFSKVLNVDKLDNLIGGSTAESLALINILTKLSNSPVLLKAVADKAKMSPGQGGKMIKASSIQEALKLLPDRIVPEDVSMSGKLTALANLLQALRESTSEKCIIVSHYTSTLNVVEAFCKKKRYTYHRLDGQTPPTKRQEYVNDFNKSSQATRFLFLLSAKAGGVGLNLIGASRLVLIDSDWNPSHDLQAMARIHRDGQKHPVFIYRFLTAGTIDEKIYQRQVTKLGLADSLMGSSKAESKSDSFSHKELRDIFRIHPNTGCQTHDILECPCDPTNGRKPVEHSSPSICLDEDDEDMGDVTSGFVVASQLKSEDINKMDKAYLQKQKAALATLGEWAHINCLQKSSKINIHDRILRDLVYSPEDEVEDEEPTEPKSRLDALLEAADFDNIAALDEPKMSLSPRDIPGGSISFLFERGSKAPVEEGEEDQ
ncbi:hypothetical protein GLOTRDRAFT_127906 [Gloeophyllum trabeum ATCC 11539]|uniref:P-loop containing nucleoside triphosphate hydrolase protein n=1 Tax=Gloeophyllum trabeum (strain ATCC 11539 / FP-39264 / Madison 617) TaxID=670483 RepID=S7RW80_GLOTA|nr:uncharacterized protein GLOTRDRAFT_127906 [Gloeophyllum trabeum ATCC 11539]EPQ57554.1 hypothetical protein GLOTRDRAFT_127906 [Gloeophyllum trabeum ATCC 11539]